MNFNPSSRSADFGKPAPTPLPNPSENATPEIVPLLGPIRKNYTQSTGRPETTPQFASLAGSIEAELSADAAIRQVAAHEVLSTPENLHRRLDAAVRNGEITSADASRYFTARFPEIDPNTLKPREARS